MRDTEGVEGELVGAKVILQGGERNKDSSLDDPLGCTFNHL
jgi:hypothetical protein